MEFLIVLLYLAILAVVYYPIFKIGKRLGFSSFASAVCGVLFFIPLLSIIVLYYYAFGKAD